jgi:hypothetical protein
MNCKERHWFFFPLCVMECIVSSLLFMNVQTFKSYRLLYVPSVLTYSSRKAASRVNLCWIKIDKLNVTCFIISPFTAEHVSNVSTFIFRNLRLIVDLFHVLYWSGSMCVGVTVWFVWGGVVSLCRLKRGFSLHNTTIMQLGVLSTKPFVRNMCKVYHLQRYTHIYIGFIF